MDVRLPDGTVIQNVPDGTTKEALAAKLKASGMAVPSEWLAPAQAPSAVEQVGAFVRDIPRQVGLFAREGIEGLAGVGDIVHEPVRASMNMLASKPGYPEMFPNSLQKMGSNLADSIGLPSPQTPTERVVGDATRMMAGGGGMAKTASVAANRVTGVAQNVFQQLAANPTAQTLSAAGSGAAGGSVREAGGGPYEQLMASVLGGVATPMLTQKVNGVVDRIAQFFQPKSEQLAQADAQIQLILKQQGIDWAGVADGLKNQMRQDAAQALAKGGTLDPDALRRLLVFRATNTTPTVGMLTQNPLQITREKNLAKVGANSTDIGLQSLPNLESQNTAQLLKNVDSLGAKGAPTKFDAGGGVINALGGKIELEQKAIDALYNAARDTAGRSLPLEGGTFTKRANELLDDAMVGGALPGDVAKVMNKIAAGQMPFTVEIAEQIKTRIGELQRATSEGTTRKALGLVRKALDETPLQAAPSVNPGSLPAAAGTVPPSQAGAGQASIDAFNQARAANRQWMSRVESTPALKAAMDGVTPDNFVDQFILSRGATVNDLKALKAELMPQGIAPTNPQNLPAVAGSVKPSAPSAGQSAVQDIRQSLVKYLKDKATNNKDDINTFSSAGYREAFERIGENKLGVFFSPDEVKQLRDIGNAGKYMQAQPAGTAVNNSNSGALMVSNNLDTLDKIAAHVPILNTIIQGKIRGMQQRQALTPANALAKQKPVDPAEKMLPANLLMLPSTYLFSN
jgi:hypothetical protein